MSTASRSPEVQLSFTSTVTVRGLRGDRLSLSAGGEAGMGGSGRGRPSGYKAVTWWDVGVRKGRGNGWGPEIGGATLLFPGGGGGAAETWTGGA